MAKEFKEEEGEALVFGNQCHEAMAKRIDKGVALPPQFVQFEPWALKVLEAKKLGAQILVEQKLAIRQDFSACTYFEKDVWFRSVGDVITLAGNVGVARDWKTGKIDEQSEQLALMAACVFATYPMIQKLATEFVWLQYNATTRVDFTRDMMPAMWAHIWPDLDRLKNAHDTGEFPPKPGGLCKRYCPVTSCVHNGSRS